jgi:hypothetical protein
VIGNPPYKEKARDRGGWIETGTGNTVVPLAEWFPPPAWRLGAHAKHLRNLYIYFWRWATWKVFGGSIVTPDTPPVTPQQGVVCFITVAGFVNGPGFEKMRADLRRDTDEIWVIDCSPEGLQPPVASRVFQAVQRPVCIVLAVRLQIVIRPYPRAYAFVLCQLADERTSSRRSPASRLTATAGWIARGIGVPPFCRFRQANGRCSRRWKNSFCTTAPE